MQALSLTALVDEHISAARAATSGRSAHTIHGGRHHSLRQTLLALAAGHSLGDHESPGEATLYVLRGHVRLSTASQEWQAASGDYLIIPEQRHNLTAIDDSAALLTVATSPTAPDEAAKTKP